MTDRTYGSEREREVVERALANEVLMDGVRESMDAVARGEKGIPGRIVQEEARARRDRELQV